MATILLIRHGLNDTTNRFLAGCLRGIHLNAAGQTQAAALVPTLRDTPINAIYSSPLERARETAAPLAQARGLPVRITPGLLEVKAGRWEGQSMAILRALPEWQALLQSPETFSFPGGESLKEIQNRAVAAVEQIAAAHAGDEVVACFSHADTIRLVLLHYLDMPISALHRLEVETGSISVIVTGNPPRVPRINQPCGLI